MQQAEGTTMDQTLEGVLAARQAILVGLIAQRDDGTKPLAERIAAARDAFGILKGDYYQGRVSYETAAAAARIHLELGNQARTARGARPVRITPLTISMQMR